MHFSGSDTCDYYRAYSSIYVRLAQQTSGFATQELARLILKDLSETAEILKHH